MNSSSEVNSELKISLTLDLTHRSKQKFNEKEVEDKYSSKNQKLERNYGRYQRS